MAYGREMLRKAGQGVGNFLLDQDAKYARAVSPAEEGFGKMTRGTSIRQMMDPNQGLSGKPEGLAEKALAAGLVYGVPTANIAARYALPVGGVTLAGAALHQLTGAFDEQTSGTIMPG